MTWKRPTFVWLDRRREERRLKRQRTGDSPEKLAEPKRGQDATVKDAAGRAGTGGGVGGGII